MAIEIDKKQKGTVLPEWWLKLAINYLTLLKKMPDAKTKNSQLLTKPAHI